MTHKFAERAPTAITAPEAPTAKERAAELREHLGAQAKLMVGASNDAYEQEADAIARQVVQRISPATSAESAGNVRGGSARIRRKSVVSNEGGAVDAETESLIASTRGGGRALEPKIRRSMGDAMGADFSGVRIHEGKQSTDLNNRIQARAFTLGSDIYMQRSLDTSSTAGKSLLAHELVHVVQQGGAAQSIQRSPGEPVGEPELGPEEETGESESVGAATDGAVAGEVVKSGSVPVSEVAEEIAIEKGPYDRATVSVSGGGDKADIGSKPVKLAASLSSLNATTTRVDTVQGKQDAIQSTTSVSWSNPGGKKTSAYGSESFNPSYKNITWTQDPAKDSPLKINFDLDVQCPWGVKSGGNIDVPSGTAGVVTAKNYQKIHDDLYPVLEEKSWRAPRDEYWSQAICERHEKYHSTDDRDWVQGPGKAFLLNELNSSTISLTPEDRASADTMNAKIGAQLKLAMKSLGSANFEFYKGGATTYASYGGEERANLDGKQPLIDLATAVKKQGESLVAAAEKKKSSAKATSGEATAGASL